MEFSRVKLALSNLLPVDAPELFKYQILVDHVKLEDACLIADSFINSPRPYTDTMAALTEKFGQPHHVALKRIAAVMDSPEIKRGDLAAFERFSLHVQSLVGMLQTLGPDGEVELKCGSHVARLLTTSPSTVLDTLIHYSTWQNGFVMSHGARATTIRQTSAPQGRLATEPRSDAASP
ncbi:guanine nucleotide-binding subunit alpha-12 isoform X2 [Labeo rohita]|uniref:Guanine nucleotide-binding subunit alpha-12 isoform X2 n=1 Tax=Labeo rohita TaxID=84645 RepID=A0A498MCB3_LABRO|nr:guanine nucleotide-binding subunit alpha-12 isoform X2 [Labeo rohita]